MGAEMVKRGRPAIERSQLHLDVIEDKAGYGSTLNEIALLLNISPATLDRWLAEPEVRTAYERGRAIAKSRMAQNLYDQALDGNTSAAIFWLKAQAGWTDRPKAEAVASSQVVFYLPENGRNGLVTDESTGDR